LSAVGGRNKRANIQQSDVLQAVAASENSVIASMVVAAPIAKAKPKTTMAKSLFMAVIPFCDAATMQRLRPARCD